MSQKTTPWFKRHPGWTLLLFNLAIILLIAIVAEIGLRIAVNYNPGYYSSVEATDTELHYAYGTIKINRDGFPDADFDLSKPLRVGYFGDSVTYGVGAGYGYRVSEYLESAYPDFEHLNLGGIGLSVSEADIWNSANKAKRYGLTHAIYLFNLNDILPDATFEPQKEPSRSQKARRFILNYLDGLRGRSYLYTYLRTQAKTALTRQGVGFHGYTAYELNPRENAEVLGETAARINRLGETLGGLGVDFHIVILPYEMQISAEAERTYASHGIRWEDGFIERGTQDVIEEFFDPNFPVWDAYFAFVPQDGTNTTDAREENAVGEFFVYDKGDTLDWNHPNREGHRKIAMYLAAQDILGDRAQPVDPKDSGEAP